MPVHQFQHGVTPTLQRNVEVRHKSPALCTIVNQFIRQQIRFQRTDPVAADTLHPIECFHKVDKPFTCRLAKIADVHASQYDFLTAFLRSLLSLLHQRGYRRIPRKTSGVRNGTIRTEIVAAILHLQEIPGSVAS